MFVTICRLYESYPEAVEVVQALEVADVPSEDISIISNNSDDWFGSDKSGTGPDTEARSAEAKPAVAQAAATRAATDSRSMRLESGLLGAAIGAATGTAGTLLGSLALLAIPGVGPAVGAGWLLGLMAAGVSEADAQVYAEGVRRGGSLVTARVQPGDINRVEAAMERGAVDIEQRGADYRGSGWRTFNPAAAPYTAAQVRSERQLHQAA
jgi:hypothetical protein